jgi:hypothetical protein
MSYLERLSDAAISEKINQIEQINNNNETLLNSKLQIINELELDLKDKQNLVTELESRHLKDKSI